MNRWSYRIVPGDRWSFVLVLDCRDAGAVRWTRQLSPSLMVATERIVAGLNVTHGRRQTQVWSGRPLVGTHRAELVYDDGSDRPVGEIEFPARLPDKRRWLRLAVGGLNELRGDSSSVPAPTVDGPMYVPGDFDANHPEVPSARPVPAGAR